MGTTSAGRGLGLNGASAQSPLQAQPKRVSRVLLAPELAIEGRVSSRGHSRLISAWCSASLRHACAARLTTELPHAGSADILILQSSSPLADPTNVASWLSDWRSAGGKLVVDYAGPVLGLRGQQVDADDPFAALRWLVEASDAVIVSSPEVGSALREQHPSVFVLPSYLDSTIWRSRSGARPQGSADGIVRIGFIGDGQELEPIAPAIGRLEREQGSRIRLEVLGGSDAKPPCGQQLTTVHGGSYADRVAWIQQQTSWSIGLAPALRMNVNAADVGHRVLQYYALGLATLASDCATTRALLNHEDTGLLVADDAEGWYRALRRLIEQPELRQRLATNGHARLHRFTIEANVSQYLATLEQVLRLPPRVDVPAWPAMQVSQAVSVRGFREELKSLRRKGRELSRDPQAFLADAASPLLRQVSSLLLLPALASKALQQPSAPQPVFPRGARVAALIETLPLPDHLRRKGRKLALKPRAFFADARSPLLRAVGPLLVRSDASGVDRRYLSGARASERPGRMDQPRSVPTQVASTSISPPPASAAVAPASAGVGAHASGTAKLRQARRLLLKIERTVLGNWNDLRRSAEAQSELGAMSTAQLPEFARSLYASTHAAQLEALSQDVSRDVAAMKELLSAGESSDALSEHVSEVRRRILQAIPKVSGQLPTPYYARLTGAVSQLGEPGLLNSVWHTLQEVDLARYGHVPRPVGPLVSVIVPVHNRQDLVADALASVFAQTYPNFELLVCDDASVDGTDRVLSGIKDPRIKLLRHEQRSGAAAARNTALRQARGELIAYLDSDNLWHPRFLEVMVEELARSPGHVCAYAGYFDVQLVGSSLTPKLKRADLRPFFLEDQLEVPFVDLNSFVHRRELCDVFGTFDERLVRRQDYDIISRYCWIREPLHVPRVLNIYQRIPAIEQITRVAKGDVTAPALIQEKIDGYYAKGLPARFPPWLKKISVISWDMSRNHFAKAFCVADALSEHLEVELISFRFFEAPIFEPLADVNPRFEIKSFEGRNFPEFFDDFAKAIHAVTGDAIYAVKPRLTSLGVALMANYHAGKPVFLEVNDLETVVASPKAGNRHVELPLEAVLGDLEQAKTPHSLLWSQALDPCVSGIPVVYTHNVNLNVHYGRRCLYMRNIKDDTLYDPTRMDRAALRRGLGYGPDDRIILFGGLVRKHKGVFELVELLRSLNDPRYKLLIVASRETPDVRTLERQYGDRITVLPPQSPARMAELNHAADLVVLWLDPSVPAGHYQSPYKISDALAMGPSVIASPTSDLATFAERDLVWMVPFGDFAGLVGTINDIFADERERARRRERGRRLFLREFSYKSVPSAVALGAALLSERERVYPVSERFAHVFSEFHKQVSRS